MKSILIGILILSHFTSIGQTISNEQIVPIYEADPLLAGEQIQFIPVNFDADKLMTKIPTDIKSLTIERIDLVYSTYKESSKFDQEKLNLARIQRLIAAWPETKNPLINWNVVGQSQATDKRSARNLFHGFVVYYREKPTPESMERELDVIDAYLRDGTFPAEYKALPGSSTPSGFHDEVVAEKTVIDQSFTTSPEPVLSAIFFGGPVGGTSVSEEALKKARKLGKTPVGPVAGENARVTSLRDEDFQNECFTSKAGVYKGNSVKFEAFNNTMMSKPRMKQGSYTMNNPIESKATEYYYVYYQMKEECDTLPTIDIDFYSPMTWDSKEFNAVQATFERHPQWQNTQIIMDVTGSMSPYIAKTMAWIKATQDSSQVSAFTFFNDGDAKSNHQKRVGSVGGIYGVANSKYDLVYKEMQQTMRKGGGGDCPENNIEATLHGLKQFPKCEEIIMVADNWATPRDLSILSEVNVPVHVIVCGGQGGINVSFIQVAYETKGSVHTIEDDLDLRSIEPGKQFQIGRNYFTLIGGKIVRAEHK